MECVLEAQPLPEIKWFQGSKQINLNDRIKMVKKDTGKDTYLLSLEISSPTIADGGNWRCNAVNAFGESNANITLNFQGTPPTPSSFLSHFPYFSIPLNPIILLPNLTLHIFKVTRAVLKLFTVRPNVFNV